MNKVGENRGQRRGVPIVSLHVGARYYDPGSGRFLQRDPVGIDGGLNVYAYAWSSPTWLIDPDGYQAGPQPVGATSMGSAQPEAARALGEAAKFLNTGKNTPYRAVDRIKGFTKHANNVAIKGKNGHGVAIRAIADAVRSRWVSQADGTYRLIGKHATLIMNEDGIIVTMWATSSAGWRGVGG